MIYRENFTETKKSKKMKIKEKRYKNIKEKK